MIGVAKNQSVKTFAKMSRMSRKCTVSADSISASAIQITTAAGLCAVLDLHVAGRLPEMGFVRQEQVDLDEFLQNRFGRYYDSHINTRFTRDLGEVPGAVHVP